jgi:hypothetical protein
LKQATPGSPKVDGGKVNIARNLEFTPDLELIKEVEICRCLLTSL